MLLRQATLADGRVRDVQVEGGTITAVEPEVPRGSAEDVHDAQGKLLLPGMVDVHVHCREPGFGHKETWRSATRSAAAGGVTTVVDQPNTDPQTTTGSAYDEKADLATEAVVDYGINGGVAPDWDPDSLLDRPLFALGEVFLADSTGDMGVSEALFAEAVERAAARDLPVTVHAEDASLFDETARESGRTDADAWSAFRTPEAEAAAVETAALVAADTDARVHVAHASTPEGIDAATSAGLSCEVTPHHLLLSRADLDELGTFGRMNPPLRSEERRAAVYERVADGTVDVVATDHAPHTRAEKDAGIWDAPSGVPGVETALPLLLAEVREGRLSTERVRDLVAATPADLFDLPTKGRVAPGYDADLVLVDLDDPREIRGGDRHTACDWTPFEGWTGVFPEFTMVRGTVVYRADGDAFPAAAGENVRAAGASDRRGRE